MLTLSGDKSNAHETRRCYFTSWLNNDLHEETSLGALPMRVKRDNHNEERFGMIYPTFKYKDLSTQQFH